MPLSVMLFREIRDARPERTKYDFIIHTEDKRGPAGVCFETLDDLKKFAAAANTLIERETAAEAVGR